MKPSASTTPAIGKAECGAFRTAVLKEYPPALSKGLAQCTLDSIKYQIRRGSLREFALSGLSDDIRSWCFDVANLVAEGSDMRPDYQGVAEIFLGYVSLCTNLRFCPRMRLYQFGASSELTAHVATIGNRELNDHQVPSIKDCRSSFEEFHMQLAGLEQKKASWSANT